MTSSTTDIAAQLEARFGLAGVELRCNLTQSELFDEAIANDRGRVTVGGPSDAQKAFPTALGKDGPLVYFSDPECTGRPVRDTFCVDRHRDSFMELVNGPVDILFANEAELLSLYETDDFDAAVQRLGAATKLAAVTRSEKGCVVLADGEQIVVPAVPIERLVDTTGAGDLFAAGFLFGRARGRDPETCGRMGCMAAGEIIQHLGARPKHDLKELFVEHGLA